MSAHSRSLLVHLHRLAALAAADATLLTRWRDQQDQDAFALLTARHGPMVLGVCRRILGDVQEAEDVFQATFLVLARKAAKLRRPEAVASFLYGAAVRLARKARAAAKRRRMIQPPLEAPEPIDPRPQPLDVLSGRELLAVLDAEMARLPEAYRLPLLLCLLQGRTIEEAARQLGWSIGSLRGRLERGREQLRRRLSRRGLGLSVGAVGLLTPAAVPENLLAESLRHLSGPIPAAVGALAGSAVSGLKLKMVCLSLFVLTAAGLGAGLSFLQAPVSDKTIAPSPAAPQQAKSELARDRYGDPLPPQAVARLGTLRFRAPAEIQAMTFAPDNKTLLVSSHGGNYLFEARSGERLRRIPSASPSWRPDDPLVFSPNGKQLIGRGDKISGLSIVPVVRVWELASGRQTGEHDMGPWVLWVGWSPEGQPLAIRVEDNGTLHLHELSTGRSRRFACAKPCKYPSGVISRNPPVACSPAGKALALQDDESIVHIWDIATGRERCTVQPKGQDTLSLSFSPDGSRFVSSTLQTVQMWNAATGKLLYTVEKNQGNYVVPHFSPNGKILAIGESWDAICFWDAATGRELCRTEGKLGFTQAVAFSVDSKWLATVPANRPSFHVWEVATGKRKAEPVGHQSRPHGAVFFPDGRRVATGGTTDGAIQFWDRTTGEPLNRIHRSGRWVRDIALSSDGQSLFSTWTDENLWVSDATSGELRSTIKLEDPDRPETKQDAISMHLSDDGKRLVALSYYYPKKKEGGPSHQDTLITGWDTSTRKQLFRRRRPSMDSWLAVSADAKVLAVPHSEGPRRLERASGMGPMRLEDVASGELLLTFPTLKGQTWPLAFSRDGRLLAANNVYRTESSKDGKSDKLIYTVRLWEILTAAEVLSLPAADFNRVAFSRDNRLLSVAAPQQEIVVWDLALGREQHRFKGCDAEVVWLSFSPDDRRLVSSLADSTSLIWDVGIPAPPRKLGAKAAAKAWDDLATTDAPRARKARGSLASAPAEALELLKEHLHPARAADAKRLRHLLADLENVQFAVRDKAQEELAKLGDLAEPALRQTLANKPTLEVRRRVQAVLERLHGPVTRPDLLQSLRAVAVLEDIGTPAARRLLAELAKGAPEARLTCDAKASLRRLALHRSFGR